MALQHFLPTSRPVDGMRIVTSHARIIDRPVQRRRLVNKVRNVVVSSEIPGRNRSENASSSSRKRANYLSIG